jgi:hypothetical protein
MLFYKKEWRYLTMEYIKEIITFGIWIIYLIGMTFTFGFLQEKWKLFKHMKKSRLKEILLIIALYFFSILWVIPLFATLGEYFAKEYNLYSKGHEAKMRKVNKYGRRKRCKSK